MPCFSPVRAWRSAAGEILFVERGDCRELEFPCGQCVGCRLERSRQWAVRIMHEASLHDSNLFVTLTYDDEHLQSPSLEYRDFQLFMRKLRKRFPRPRFYMCGEYGEEKLRPHFHACLFGVGFPDMCEWRKSPSGHMLYRSKQLEALWPHGNSEIGELTFESAAYVARYVMKKVNGQAADWIDPATGLSNYQRVSDIGELVEVEPEFCEMSRRPGIGYDWLRLYWQEVYNGDGDPAVVMNGQRSKPPRYYDQIVKGMGQFEYVQHQRALAARKNSADNSDARLAVKEQVTKARLNLKKRSLK